MFRSRRGTRSGGSRLGRWLLRLLLGVALLSLLPVLALRFIPPPFTAFMLTDRPSGGPHAAAPVLRYQWVDWKAIAPAMRLAVVAAEDQKFPKHWGFDLDSIQDALDHPSRRGRLRGASTITQQVARNLFLWRGRSFARKGLEVYFTALLEVCWSKRRILEVYLNVAELGEGIYGVAAASEIFFNKRPAALQAGEAALLAAVLPNPKRFSVRAPSAYVRERATWIETQMAQLGGPAYLRPLQ